MSTRPIYCAALVVLSLTALILIGPARAADLEFEQSLAVWSRTASNLESAEADIEITVNGQVYSHDDAADGYLSFTVPTDAEARWTLVSSDLAHRIFTSSLSNGLLTIVNDNLAPKTVDYLANDNGTYSIDYWQWSLFLSSPTGEGMPLLGRTYLNQQAADPKLVVGGPIDYFGGGQNLSPLPGPEVTSVSLNRAVTNRDYWSMERIWPYSGVDRGAAVYFGLMWQWTKPDGDVETRWLPIGTEGTEDNGLYWRTRLGENAGVANVQLFVRFPLPLAALVFQSGTHRMTYWLQSEAGIESNKRQESFIVN